MPYTKRHAIHDGAKGLTACLNYVMDVKKTDGGILVSGCNCNPEFAIQQFQMTHNKFHAPLNACDRVAYHAIQSFDYKDNITPQQANEIGVKLCKQLYPDFECVVSTHIDKGHLHNHIIINAISMEGRKLEDRLANPLEGLYGLRDASDTIALEYGCNIIKNAPKIGRYKSKNYVYQAVNVSWKQRIIEKLEELKETCNSYDELMENLSLEGYIIKGGKHIAVKPYGKERFTRLSTLGAEYDTQALQKYFYSKRTSYHFEDYLVTNPESKILSGCDALARLSKEAVIFSSNGLQTGKSYPRFFRSRAQELKRYHQLVAAINYLNDEHIYSFEDLSSKVFDLQYDFKEKEKDYLKQKSQNSTLQSRVPIAQVYLEYYGRYMVYEEQKRIMQGTLEEPEEVKIFLDAKHQLENASLQDVKEILATASKSKQELNKRYAHLSYLKQQATQLDKIRMQSLDSNPNYIKSLSFSKDMIDEDRSTNEAYCIRLPYTDVFVYLNKECIAWTNYNVRATMYLIDDQEYNLFDKEDNIVQTIDGEDLASISNVGKDKIITSKYNSHEVK